MTKVIDRANSSYVTLATANAKNFSVIKVTEREESSNVTLAKAK